MTPGQVDYVVRDLEGKPAGVLSLKKVKELPTDQWAATSLASLLLVPFPMVNPNEPIDDALEMMVERSITTIPVVDERTGELLGELTATDAYSLLLGSE